MSEAKHTPGAMRAGEYLTKREHIVRFNAGYDCIRFECKFGSKTCKPHSGGSHGVYGMGILFVTKGEAGAVQFLLSTGWLPQRAEPSNIGVRNAVWASPMGDYFPVPMDLGYHSKKPMFEGHTCIEESCEFCNGQPCYYDGSSLNANDAMYALVNGGDKALWAFLEGYYRSVFEGADYPVPAEYPKPPRDQAIEKEK